MAKETPERDIWAELRKPFDPKSISKLPKGNVTLDYVGHAAVTDRLNSVDPTWTWEPMAKDDYGNPLLIQTTDNFNKPLKGLWIRLTIGGVTRPGFGDGKTEKEAIGDALRNAAMRFGVALELWSKDELESNLAPGKAIDDLPIEDVPNFPAPPAPPPPPPKPAGPITDEQTRRLGTDMKMKGITDKQEAVNTLDRLAKTINPKAKNFLKLTQDEADELHTLIKKTPTDQLKEIKA